jgi:hypothetical protein
VTAIADLISPRNRKQLLDRLAELAEVDRLVREPGGQRPPDQPPALAELAERDDEETAQWAP